MLMNMPKHKILIVEDDEDIALITKMHLEHAGYETNTVHNCEDAKIQLQNKFDLVLLDLMLPDGDGREICSDIRKVQHCPVIFLTCIDDENIMVEAFKLGADDYVVKPVQYNVLLARIEAHIRKEKLYEAQKKNNSRKKEDLILKSFEMDLVHRNLRKNGEVIALSVIEYELLTFMVNNPNTLLLYDELYSSVWVKDSFGDVRTVMVHISNIRKKIDPERKGIIQTVRGAGYVFNNIAT